MKLYALDDFYKNTENRYEAVHVAAKHARKLNEKASKEVEETQIDPASVPFPDKVIIKALDDVIKGKVKFVRGKEGERRR